MAGRLESWGGGGQVVGGPMFSAVLPHARQEMLWALAKRLIGFAILAK